MQKIALIHFGDSIIALDILKTFLLHALFHTMISDKAFILLFLTSAHLQSVAQLILFQVNITLTYPLPLMHGIRELNMSQD